MIYFILFFYLFSCCASPPKTLLERADRCIAACGWEVVGGHATVVSSSARVQALLEVVNDLFEEQTDLEKIVRKIMHRAQTLLKCERCSVQLLEDIESPVCCFCLPSFLWARPRVWTRNEKTAIKKAEPTYNLHSYSIGWSITSCIGVFPSHIPNQTHLCCIFNACSESSEASLWCLLWWFWKYCTDFSRSHAQIYVLVFCYM